MKIRFIAFVAVFFLVLGILIIVFSFETIPSKPPENLSEGMVPITPKVGKTTAPVGIYMITASIPLLIGTGIYSIIDILKRTQRK